MNLDPLTPQARAIREWLRLMFFATRREEILMSTKDLKREIFLKQGSLPDIFIINAVKELGAEPWNNQGKAATRAYSYQRIVEAAEGVTLEEVRVMIPGRPFVFRRADFIDDNTWSASAAFEQQNKPGREATTRTTMDKNERTELEKKLRKTRKSELWETQRNLAVEKMALRGDVDRLNAEKAVLLKDKNEVDRMYVSVTTRNTDLEQELHEVKTRLEQWRHDAQTYKRWHDKACGERDTAMKALTHQALGIGRLTEHMEPREVVSMTAMNTEG